MLPSLSLAKDKMIVKLKPTVSQREYAYVVDSTRSIVQEDSGASLLERKPLVNSIDDAQLALDIYFYILSVLCCILLFFATSVSRFVLSTNPYRSIIWDTSHEIGIFQSLGATKVLLYTVRFNDAL